MFSIYINGRLSLHLQGPSCEEVGNKTSQLPTTSQVATPRSCTNLTSQLHECKHTHTVHIHSDMWTYLHCMKQMQ